VVYVLPLAVPLDPTTQDFATLIERAHGCERQSRRDEARALYEAALLRLAEATAEINASAIARSIARTHLADANYEAARDCIELSLTLAELAGDDAGSHCTNQMAVPLAPRRPRFCQAALPHGARAGCAGRRRSLVAMTSTNIGVIASVRGDHQQALRYFESSIREYRLLGMSRDVCIALNNVGLVQTRLGTWDEAEGSFRQALDIAATLGDADIATQLEINLAQAIFHRGDFAAASRLIDRALLAAQAHQLGDSQAGAYKLAGSIAKELGNHDEALVSLAGGRPGHPRGNLLLLAEVEHKRAEVYRQLGRNQDALQSLNAAHRLFAKMQARHDVEDIAQETRALQTEFLVVAHRWGESTESKDRYTQGHCERVADVACQIAAAAGLDESELLCFRIGALLHDVGKLIVPSEVLNKPGRLTRRNGAHEAPPHRRGGAAVGRRIPVGHPPHRAFAPRVLGRLGISRRIGRR
jgi:tetratricopeptide (TPR) repeat protein